MLGKSIPCDEEKRCYFEDWKFSKQLGRKVKHCRILIDPEDKAPYPNGRCPYYKKTRASYSGSHEGEEYSEEMIDRIRNNEYEYKLRKGIIGRKGTIL